MASPLVETKLYPPRLRRSLVARPRLSERLRPTSPVSSRSPGNGTTLIEGPVVDQAALHGLLRTLRDIGIPLLSVTHVDTGR